jgi:8-oxo-dGTP pyrophosphatase MutT (NUDIX family)
LVARRHAAFTRTPALDTHGLKRAAVAVTLVESDDGSGETAFVLTRRGRALRAHKRQYALPGGGCEEGETAVAAALRELEEELGLRLSADDVLGMLDDYRTRSGYLITPVVIWAEQTQPLLPNPEEVASVHRIPLAEIARADAIDFILIPESDRRVIRIRMNGSLVPIWSSRSLPGANAVMIQVLPIIGNPIFTTGPAALSFASPVVGSRTRFSAATPGGAREGIGMRGGGKRQLL